MAESPELSISEKKEAFIDGLQPRIAVYLRGQKRLSMTEISDLAVAVCTTPGAPRQATRRTATANHPGRPTEGKNRLTRRGRRHGATAGSGGAAAEGGHRDNLVAPPGSPPATIVPRREEDEPEVTAEADYRRQKPV